MLGLVGRGGGGAEGRCDCCVYVCTQPHPRQQQVVFGAMGVNMETARYFRTSFEESGAMQVRGP